MKTLLAAAAALLIVVPLTAKDLGVRTQAKIEITTNTSYGYSLDDPDQQGLKIDFSHFNIQFGLANGGLISNKIKSDDPFGFMQFEFGGLQMNWGNTSSLFDKDMNNPGKNTTLGFNTGDKGYTYPIYIERFVSGIQWRAFDTDMVLQLAAGGDAPENWRPWSNIQRGYINSEFLQRSAYLDTRVQYQRGPIPNLYNQDPDRGGKMNPVGIMDDPHYWSHGNANDPTGLPQNLALNPEGTLVGYQVAGADFAAMLKFVTEKTWAEAATDKNGMAFGLDLAYSPSEWKALKTYASAGKVVNYGKDGNPQPLGFGGKFGVDVPLSEGLSLEPYVGYQGIRWDKIGTLTVTTGSNDATTEYKNADEASAGVTLHWPGNGGWQWDPLEQRNGVSFPGLTVAYSVRNNNAQYLSNSDATLNSQQIGAHPIHNLLVTLFEESGDYGVVPGLGASLSVQYLDFLNKKLNSLDDFQAATASGKLLATTYLDYTLVDLVPGELVPWTRLYYDRLTDQDGEWVQNVKVDAGVKLSKAIRNTVFGVTYESRNLTGLGKADDDTSSTDPYHGFYGLGLLKAWIEVSL